MIFEMITGDFLFEPRKSSTFDKDDDHLAQMMEILGKMPKNFALSGKHSKRFFDSSGHLQKIRGLQHWPLTKVLMEKYKMREREADELADFLLPMLEWYPEKRATAQEMLSHPWLNMPSNYDTSMDEAEFQKMMLRAKLMGGTDQAEKEMSELCESEDDLFGADSEDNRASVDSDPEPDESFFKLTKLQGRVRGQEESLSEDSDIENRVPGPNYLNNSFTGPYPEDMSRPNMDKGPNP
jgi:serine/threonine protein kinase